MSDHQFNTALDLMRRLPPQRVDRHLSFLIDLQPELCADLLGTVDVPLKIDKDEKSKRQYLTCDYNRDGDSYRSPWSGEYSPPLDDGAAPSPQLRILEIALNDAFDEYRKQYFEGGVSSVYLWDQDDGFAGAVLIKKSSDSIDNTTGCWDSIHVIEVTEDPQMRTASYKLTSTIMLWLQTNTADLGILNLGGSLTRVVEKRSVPLLKGTSDHVKNIGPIIENMENNLRNGISTIYFSKTKDIINTCRSVNTLIDDQHKRDLAKDLHKRLNNTNNVNLG